MYSLFNTLAETEECLCATQLPKKRRRVDFTAKLRGEGTQVTATTIAQLILLRHLMNWLCDETQEVHHQSWLALLNLQVGIMWPCI